MISGFVNRLDKFRWVIVAFALCAFLIAGLLIWQLTETSPSRWCAVAEVNDISASGCFQLLLALVEVKDHAIIGLLTILGITVIAVVAVTFNLKIEADGPGGTGLNVGPSDEPVPFKAEGTITPGDPE